MLFIKRKYSLKSDFSTKNSLGIVRESKAPFKSVFLSFLSEGFRGRAIPFIFCLEQEGSSPKQAFKNVLTLMCYIVRLVPHPECRQVGNTLPTSRSLGGLERAAASVLRVIKFRGMCFMARTFNAGLTWYRESALTGTGCFSF